MTSFVSPLNIIHISKDTSMAFPWGIGDLAVVLAPFSNWALITECTYTEYERQGDTVRFKYNLGPKGYES